MRCVRFAWFAFAAMFLSAHVGPAAAEDISGTLVSTKIILEDSQLVGNVTCTATAAPCLMFGAPNIALRLKGFTITGPANPDDTTTCQATSGLPAADGISNGTSAATSQAGVRIIGPGMVQKFRRHGILIVGAAGTSTNVRVMHVTSNHNCFSGLLTNLMTDSVIEGIIPKADAENLVIVCGVFIHWDAKDNQKIFKNNYDATKLSIARAMKGEPKIDEIIAKKSAAKHPFSV